MAEPGRIQNDEIKKKKKKKKKSMRTITPTTGGSSMGWNVADLRADKDKLKEARPHWLQQAGNRAPFPETPSAEEVEDESRWIDTSLHGRNP